MDDTFERGYPRSVDSLLRSYPGIETYPAKDFRVEWGPIFHRGRLDGSARVVVLGQDPASHESIARRILVGEAGQRVQGLLAKVGITRSYVMINTFLYSVFGQGGGERHKNDPAIAAYRNKWLDKLVTADVEAVIGFGLLAEHAYGLWRATPKGAASTAKFFPLRHPTFPESASASGQLTKPEAFVRLFDSWNAALPKIKRAVTPDEPRRRLVKYSGTKILDSELAPIPAFDLPPGIPPWMRSVDAWASRRPINEAQSKNATPEQIREAKRAGIGVRVPTKQRVWHTP